MIGSVSGLSNSAYLWLNTHKPVVSAAANTAYRNEPTTLPVQPVPATREVVSQEAKVNIESMLQEHASDPVSMAVRMRIHQLSSTGEAGNMKSAREVVEDETCQTCANRKYQDGSDDPGVSFKTATHLSPEQAATAVRSHEMEHVSRNRAKADREDREIVSQIVTIRNEICPECGDVFTAGGTTRTVTRGDNTKNTQPLADTYPAFSAIA